MSTFFVELEKVFQEQQEQQEQQQQQQEQQQQISHS